MTFKIGLIILLLCVLISLFSALAYLIQGKSRNFGRALFLRIGLSLLVFGLLILAYFQGWIKPHGI